MPLPVWTIVVVETWSNLEDVAGGVSSASGGFSWRDAGDERSVRVSEVAQHRNTDGGRGCITEVGGAADRVSGGTFRRHRPRQW